MAQSSDQTNQITKIHVGDASGILGLHIDADPGGHAKWVRSPHGPATVSGYAALGPWSTVPGPGSATELRLGKARAADSRRKSGNLITGGVLFFGAEDAEGAHPAYWPASRRHLLERRRR